MQADYGKNELHIRVRSLIGKSTSYHGSFYVLDAGFEVKSLDLTQQQWMQVCNDIINAHANACRYESYNAQVVRAAKLQFHPLGHVETEAGFLSNNILVTNQVADSIFL